ncbi:MAG: HrpE/YscL family type III secretion apparatus protein [Verrucomicrobia bacterium]|nr:HrpE/YscL family type III secretion apparatus protein [Verrucomicrobiota bacterium]MBU6445878.1 HrpE/YscL family type III secretion apparatus protein [Verrucomicrobiota bacterium]MDE3048112.1 HrpE/YscL family type III secretion apparatus protein [Verrucomicrobiota bacterium]
MKKFFSLISGKEVRLAPGTKIVPAQEFETLESASDILNTVKAESYAYRQEVVKESEQIKAEAFQEGFQEGLISLNKHLFALDAELKVLREEVQKNILPLALKAAKKIIGDELKLHPERIVDVVLTSLKPVTQHRKIIIYVNKADLDYLETSKQKIKNIFEHLESLSIQERGDIEPGGCMIETEAGIINAQLENQWRAMEAAFEAFMKK